MQLTAAVLQFFKRQLANDGFWLVARFPRIADATELGSLGRREKHIFVQCMQSAGKGESQSMIDPQIVNQIKQASNERTQIIEFILQSLKKDIRPELEVGKSQFKPFKIRKFSLGEEIHVARDKLYSERS